METQQAVSHSSTLDEHLEKLYRENVKLCEEVQHIVEGKSNDMNLLDSLKILAGLREASEDQLSAAAAIPPRSATSKVPRGGPKPKSSKPAIAVSAVTPSTELPSDSPVPSAPSPRISLSGPASRLLGAKDKSSRAGSLPITREPSVSAPIKLEVQNDGAESVASSADGTTTSGTGKTSLSAAQQQQQRPTNRLVLRMGEIVFCRHAPAPNAPPPEGEGILCRVTSVIGEGKQRRYEVQDADLSGSPPPSQRASVAQLIQIPETNKGLGDLAKGRGVLAQYPDTTTFYKAQVVEAWKRGDAGGRVKVMFEDDEADKEVERRFVFVEK